MTKPQKRMKLARGGSLLDFGPAGTEGDASPPHRPEAANDVPPRQEIPQRQEGEASVLPGKAHALVERLRGRLAKARQAEGGLGELGMVRGAPEQTEPLPDLQASAPPRLAEGEYRQLPLSRAPDPYPESAIEKPDSPYWRPLIDPVQVVSGIFRSKMLIVGCTIAGALLGVMVALSTPKIYSSTAELLVDPRNLNIVERDITQSGLPSDATLAIVENQVRVLTSSSVVNRVVAQLNLDDDPEFNGEGGTFSPGALIGQLRGLISFSGTGNGDNSARRTARAVDNLYRALYIRRGDRTFVISITATTQDGDKSALIANTLTEVFLETYGEIQAGAATRATGELTARLDELRAGVEEAERRVEQFKSENEIIDAQGRLITDDEIVRLNEQLTVARARTIELNARAASARAVNVQSVIEGSLPEEATSGLMTELRGRYANLKQDVDRLAARLGPRHPERIAAEAQLTGAREQIEIELRRLVSTTQAELRRAVQFEQDLAARLAQLKVRQGDMRGELVTLRELEREATAKRAVYEQFLLRSRETGEQQALNTANFSLISRATAPLEPSGPSRATTALGGTVLGLLFGIGLGAVRGGIESLRRGTAGRSHGTPRRPATPVPIPPAGRAREPSEPVSNSVNKPSKPQENTVPPYPPYPYAAGPADPRYAPPYWQPDPRHQQAAWPTPHHPGQQPYPHPAYPQSQPWPQQPPPGWGHAGYVAYPYPQHAPDWQGTHQAPPSAPPQPPQGYREEYPGVRARDRHAEEQQMTFEEIRDSLREFREALHELSEGRARKRFF